MYYFFNLKTQVFCLHELSLLQKNEPFSSLLSCHAPHKNSSINYGMDLYVDEHHQVSRLCCFNYELIEGSGIKKIQLLHKEIKWNVRHFTELQMDDKLKENLNAWPLEGQGSAGDCFLAWFVLLRGNFNCNVVLSGFFQDYKAAIHWGTREVTDCFDDSRRFLDQCVR